MPRVPRYRSGGWRICDAESSRVWGNLGTFTQVIEFYRKPLSTKGLFIFIILILTPTPGNGRDGLPAQSVRDRKKLTGWFVPWQKKKMTALIVSYSATRKKR